MDISVIIPIYNGERWLRECLDSVFNQTFKGEIEVICSVDPSTDKTKEIISEYQKIHSNLIMIDGPGKGAASNRMNGINVSRGKYLCFLDADDLYLKDTLETLYNEIEKGYDIVNGSFYNQRGDKRSKNFFTKNRKMNSLQAVKAMLLDSYWRSFNQSKIFKRELFFKDIVYPKYHGVIFEDTVMVFSMLMNVNKVKNISKPVYIYRDNENSLTKSVNKDRFASHLYCYAMMRYLCDKKGKEYVKAFRNYYLRTWASLVFDASLCKKPLNKSKHQIFKEYKKEIQALKGKKPLQIEGYKWESYFKNVLN